MRRCFRAQLLVQRAEPCTTRRAQRRESTAAEVDRAIGCECLPQRSFARRLQVLFDRHAKARAAQQLVVRRLEDAGGASCRHEVVQAVRDLLELLLTL